MSTEINPAPGLSYPQKEGGLRLANDDAGLVERCRRGDLEAFEQLVTKHQKKMLNIAFRIIGDYDEACEAVQDAFVSAHRNIATFRGEAKFTTWMTTITLNYARNRLKQIRSRSSHIALSLNQPLSTDKGELVIDPPDPGPSQLDRLESSDVRRKVHECIQALDPEYREVIVLRDLQDLSYAEIGTCLKVREGTVKSRLFRAREAVKDCLKRAWGALR